MIALLLRLYPARWRERYGDEFASVLEERPLGPFDVADVLLGALDAHLHLRGLGAASEHRKGFAMSLRIGGYAAIVGGFLFVAGFLANGLDGSDDAWPTSGIILAGIAVLLVGIAGLSAFQARRYPALVWAAFLVPFIGGLLAIAGLAFMGIRGDADVALGVSGWGLGMIGLITLTAGSGLFALATWRTGMLSRTGTALSGHRRDPRRAPHDLDAGGLAVGAVRRHLGACDARLVRDRLDSDRRRRRPRRPAVLRRIGRCRLTRLLARAGVRREGM